MGKIVSDDSRQTLINISISAREVVDPDSGAVSIHLTGAVHGALEGSTIAALITPAISAALDEQISKIGGIGSLGLLFSKLRGGGKPA